MAPSCEDDLPPVDRRSINATITKTLNELFDLGITDAFCGYKAQRVSSMRQLRLDEPGYAFPLQLWPRAVQHGLRITEIPVRLIYNDPNRHFGGLLDDRSEEHTLNSSHANISYAVFCLKKKTRRNHSYFLYRGNNPIRQNSADPVDPYDVTADQRPD